MSISGFWGLPLYLLFASGLTPSGISAQVRQGSATLDEAQARARILVGVATYVNWPVKAPAGKPFVIAVLGQPAPSALPDIASKRTVQGRPIQVLNSDWPKVPAECDLVYICGSEESSAQPIVTWCSHRNVLTVCENPDLLQRGVMAAIALKVDKLQVFLNRKAMADRSLVPDSQLLAHASIVESDKGPAPGSIK